MSEPLVSVVMAARNAERHLSAAIESILRQTHRALELVLVDDGSTDSTGAIAARYAAADDRVVIGHGAGTGLAAALNKGIDLARGEWIARMDADDVAKPARLATQLAFCAKHDLQLCGCDVRTFGSTWPRVRRHYRSDRAIRLQLLFGSAFSHPAVLCRTDVLRAARYDPHCRAAQDYELWTRLALSGVRLGNVRYVGMYYRVHGKQVTLNPQYDQIESALPAALNYWRRSAVTELPQGTVPEDRTIAALFRRTRTDDAVVVQQAVELCVTLARSTADPEGVISDNVFKFLLRCSGAALRGADLSAFHHSIAQRAVLRLAQLGIVHWDMPLVQLARRRLR
jgi:hypothetical protein